VSLPATPEAVGLFLKSARGNCKLALVGVYCSFDPEVCE
jgi:hypothetical protein